MTKLLVDALIALTKLTDRGLTAIESVRLRTLPQSVADAQPAGVGDSPVSAPDTGGHPDDDDDDRPPTSDLLDFAAEELLSLAQRVWPTPQPFIEAFAAELRERAQELVDLGD